MASGTISGTTNNTGISSKIVWSASTDVDANESTVTATLYYKRLNNYTTYGTGDFTLAIGSSKKTESNYISIKYGEWTEAITLTVPVEHNSDGTMSVTISATGGIDGTTLTSTDCSATVTLDTIPRASTISSAANKTLGNTCEIKWYPKSASFRYKLKFTLGDWSYTTGAIYPNQTTLYTYEGYTIPLTVANQITDAKKATMTVTLYTYSNSGATTQVGSADADTFTVTVPNNSSTKPSVTLVLAPVSALDEAFSSLYVQGKSKVKATTLTGAGKYGATIASYSLTVLGKSYSSPYQSDYLNTSGTITVTAKVTDSRGYYTEVEKEITVIPYNDPKILPASTENTIVCARCNSDGTIAEDGEYLRIIAKRSYSKVASDDGAQNNFCDIRYRYRPESTKTYSDWITLLSGDDTEADTVDSGAISGVVSSATTAYVIQIGVIDDVGGADAYQISIPTAFATVDIPKAYKGRSIGIFRFAVEPADGEKRVDVDGVIHGGGIDNLTLGTMLTATAEAPITLADLLTPGNYYSPNATNTQYITDSPYKDGGFGLEVRELQHKDYIRQTMYYGRTTIWRHYNGSEWSDWVRAMVSTEFETACTDFVIEQGTSGGWTYKKWKSGTYEMFGEFDVAPGTSTLNGSVYRTGSIAIDAPFTISSAMVSGTAVGFYWISNGGTSGTSAVNIRIISDKTISAATVTVRLHVVGTYA